MKVLRLRIASVFILLLLLAGCRTAVTVPADEAAEAWYNLGNAYTELGRHDDAVKAYIKARQLNPELINAGFNLARIHIMQERYDEGLLEIEELLGIDPQNRLLLETKAWIMHLKGDNTAALEIYNTVLSIFVDSRNTLYNSALILNELEEHEEALKRLRRLVELYPDEETAVYEIAMIEVEMGNSREALLLLQKYLDLEPNNFSAVELQGDMHTVLKQYSDAVTSYRLITDKFAGEQEADAEDSLITPDFAARVFYKSAEILLLFIEDTEGGLSALESCVNLGWVPEDEWELILSYTEAEWYEQAVSIIPEQNETPESEDSDPGA